MYALLVQLLIASLDVPVLVYWTAKNAIAGKSSYTVTETIFVSVPAVPSTVSRSPSPKVSFVRPCFCEARRNPVQALSAVVTVSEAVNGPITVSVLSKRATTRLRRLLSNSMRRFPPLISGLSVGVAAAAASEQDANTVVRTIQDLIAIMARSFRRRLPSDRKTFFLVENIGHLLDRCRHMKKIE